MTCQRVWEAEAIEDGRLDAPSTASFARHVGACSDCARASNQLRALREVGRRIEPRRLSPFEQRRKRGELLRRANAEAIRPPRRFLASFLWIAAAVVLVFVGYRVERQADAPGRASARVAAHSAPVFELRPMGDAAYHQTSGGAATRIVLATGTLAVHVEHLIPGQRFVIALPDGELEVQGTRFIVEANGGRTERVMVTEGVVSLRLAGAPERLLTAGESFAQRGAGPSPGAAAAEERAEPPARRDTTTSMDESGATKRHAHSAKPGSVEGPGRVAPAVSAAGAAASAASAAASAASADVPRAGGSTDDRSGSTAPPDTAAGEAFHQAMAAFSTGSYAEADERFAEFAGRFAADGRSEDAVFLRTVIALRRGDPAAAVARARAYLRRFPDGFRRKEIEKMLEATRSASEPPTTR